MVPSPFKISLAFFSVNHMQVAGGTVLWQKPLASHQVLGELRSGLAAPPHTRVCNITMLCPASSIFQLPFISLGY